MSPASDSSERLAYLLAAVAAGDQRAFGELYQSCSAHLYGLLLRILRRTDWAQEALQDCFLKIWQKSASYEPAKGAPLAWLSTIARYRALDLLRARRPEVELPEDDGPGTPEAEDSGSDPLVGAVTEEGVGALRRCLQTLTQEQRDSVLLAYYEGYTHQELAARLRAPLGTVKSWVRRGLMRLRECLSGEPGR